MFSSRDGLLSRREWLKLSALGALSVPASGWLNVLAARAAEPSQLASSKHKSCILLFMEGGPSHLDTFDPKPENKSSEIKPIKTAVPGIQVCEHLPKHSRIADRFTSRTASRGTSTSSAARSR